MEELRRDDEATDVGNQRDVAADKKAPGISDDACPDVVVPQRRAAIGAPQELSDEDDDFLIKAFELNLPLVLQQRNPKAQRSASRQRYEKYKSEKCLRDVKKMGGSWADISWDYCRGWIDFTPSAVRVNFADLWDERRDRGIAVSASAQVDVFGNTVTSDPFQSFSYAESMHRGFCARELQNWSGWLDFEHEG